VFILNYHGVSERVDEFEKVFQKHLPLAVFREQMERISKKKNPLSLNEFLSQYKDRRLKSNDVLVSFDDGYKNLLDGAVGIIKSLNIPAVFSIATERVDAPSFWADEVERAIRFSLKASIEIEGRKFDLSDTNRRIKTLIEIKSWMKNMMLEENRRVRLLLLSVAGVSGDEHNLEKFKIMTWEEIKDLTNDSYFNVVHHSHRHYPLSKLGTAEKIVEDVALSVKGLRKIGIEPEVFVYPFGRKEDCGEEVKVVVKDLGFIQGWTVQNKPVDYKDPFEVYRLEMTGDNFEKIFQ